MYIGNGYSVSNVFSLRCFNYYFCISDTCDVRIVEEASQVQTHRHYVKAYTEESQRSALPQS